MSGGAYAALSGMQTKLAELDRIASDLANVNTAGYKTERAAPYAAERDFATTLQSAVDATSGGATTDMRSGAITRTGGPLDVAIDGAGFFAVETSSGVRYTRSGNFTKGADGTLTTPNGEPVLDATGKRIKLGQGAVTIEADGTVRVGEAAAGKIALWRLKERDLIRESGARFRPVIGVKPEASDAVLMPGAIEHANVSMERRMISLVSLMRNFEALQKGMSVLMNDVDARAIVELGRR